MKIIERDAIHLLFSEAMYRRGVAYYNKGNVINVSFDRNHQVWNATVQGSDVYYIEIDIENPTRLKLKHDCDCPAHEAYGECKHVVAVLLEIADEMGQEKVEGFNQFDYDKTSRLIQSLSSVNRDREQDIGPLTREPMEVEYILSWTLSNNLFVEIKTGLTHKYIVRNIKDLLENVLNGMEHEFTKKFTYHPDHHYFLKKDIAAFEMIYDIIRNDEIYNRTGYRFYNAENNDVRYQVIPPLAIKPFLHALIERNLTVSHGFEEYTDVQIEEESLPFNFEVSKSEKDDLVFSLGDLSGATYFESYGLMFHNGVFYFPKREQMPVLEEMMRLSIGQNQFPIAKDQADLFLSEVLPSIKQVGQVTIADNVKEEIIDLPLKAKMYLEMQEGLIHGKLEYNYGDILINPFLTTADHGRMILRDVEKEQRIMKLIEFANFHYNGSSLYIDEDEDQLFDFLYHVLPKLENELELFVTSDIRNIVVEKEIEPETRVRIDESANLLDIGFDITGVNQEEVEAILSAVIERRKYYRMDSGAFLSLENEGFKNVQKFFSEMDMDVSDTVNGSVKMPIFRGAEIDQLLDTKKVYDLSFRKLLHHLKSPEEQVYELPEQLQADLRPYQNTGFQWFKSLSDYHLGGILADDMGLGKTLQSIAYMASELHGKPHLIVAPSSVVYNWKNECAKFSPQLNVTVLIGTPIEREEMFEKAYESDVIITSYATLRQDIGFYREKTFQTLILDEAQYIKNYRTKTSQAIREVVASRKFALSGTPIENSIDELWAIFQVILPGLMPNQKKFKNLSHEKIARMTQPFILRRLKQDVLTELPDKIESVHISELKKEQKDLYVGYLNQLRQETAASLQTGSFGENRMKVLAGLTRLRQICCHPALFMENYTGGSGKLEQLLEMVDSFIENGNRMLIFSQFTSMHEILIPIFEERGIEYFYLHGGTKSSERVKMCDRFNEGEKSIFLISLKAGGTGLNLTGADTVILYDLWWNPAVEDQAAGRAHRFGQKKVVQVIRLLAEGTIEEKIFALQQKKRELIDAVIQPGEKMLSGLSEDDIKELLSI